MFKVEMHYRLREFQGSNLGPNSEVKLSDLERIAELSTQIKQTKTWIEFDSAPQRDVSVEVYLPNDDPSYVVVVESQNRDRINNALERFIGQCGAPNFVRFDYELILPILKKRGQTLKRRFSGALIGKHVVPV